MKILCVYFDLNEPEQQSGAIITYLNSFNAGIRAGDRAWFVKSTKTPEQIQAEIGELSMPPGYHILIFEVSSKWTTYNTRDEVNSWMGKHI